MNAHVSQGGWPVLVLNADFRPLSYYPLSLWSWQDAIKAVFLDRVNIVAHYEHAVRSPSFEMQLPSVVSLKIFREAVDAIRPSRDSTCSCATVSHASIADGAEDLTFDHIIPRTQGRPNDMGKRRRGLLAVQSAQGQHDAAAGRDVPAAAAVPADRASVAPKRPAVSAELSARKLDGLSLLGYRTRSLAATSPCRFHGERLAHKLIPRIRHCYIF